MLKYPENVLIRYLSFICFGFGIAINNTDFLTKIAFKCSLFSSNNNVVYEEYVVQPNEQ